MPIPQASTAKLLKWFQQNNRDLPWRKAKTKGSKLRNPYHVWVSEIMLQQTQVATVIPYFEKWLTQFPTLEDFANADLDDVLKLWEGLGYYRRARNFHKAAQYVVTELDGQIPDSSTALIKLSGIGNYTAAAIASLAFGEDVLAVDGNVKRVASRLFCIPGEITEAVSEAKVKKHLEPMLPTGKAGNFNEALMELGATVCTAKQPKCESCPIKEHCLAFQKNKVSAYPAAKKKKIVPHKERFAVVYVSRGRVWLEQRNSSGMLAGLWGFPLEENQPEGTCLNAVKHAYTHFKITVTPVITKAKPNSEGKMVLLKQIDDLALSTLDHKILKELQKAKKNA